MLISSFPWYTGAIKDYQKFSGKVLADSSAMEVSSFHFFSNVFLIGFFKGFVSGMDRFDSQLFSSRSFTRTQDYDLQKMMGVDVRVEDDKDIVTPCQNALSEGRIAPTFATRLFTALSGYRILDIITLLKETYPPPFVVERTPEPSGSLQVRTLNLFCIMRNSFLVLVFRCPQGLV